MQKKAGCGMQTGFFYSICYEFWMLSFVSVVPFHWRSKKMMKAAAKATTLVSWADLRPKVRLT